MASSLIGAIANPKRTEGLITNVVANSVHNLVQMQGPGLFLSAEITKQGGSNNLTFVSLTIDGQSVITDSIAALLNQGLGAVNFYGIMVSKGPSGLNTVTIGLPYPLTFQRNLVLQVTVNEPGVVQIVANVLTAS